MGEGKSLINVEVVTGSSNSAAVVMKYCRDRPSNFRKL